LEIFEPAGQNDLHLINGLQDGPVRFAFDVSFFIAHDISIDFINNSTKRKTKQITVMNTKKIEVAGNELQFFRKNAPKGFAGLIAEQLSEEGHKIGRIKVHAELHTIKDGYDEKIINTARQVLKNLKGLEYQEI